MVYVLHFCDFSFKLWTKQHRNWSFKPIRVLLVKLGFCLCPCVFSSLTLLYESTEKQVGSISFLILMGKPYRVTWEMKHSIPMFMYTVTPCMNHDGFKGSMIQNMEL